MATPYASWMGYTELSAFWKTAVYMIPECEHLLAKAYLQLSLQKLACFLSASSDSWLQSR